MITHFKITRQLRGEVLQHLARRHPFAAERVGFISCRPTSSPSGLVILGVAFHTVADEDYLPDRRVGAMMGPAAIRKALEFAYNNQSSMFHVHMHDHDGEPRFSGTDLRETAKFVPNFFHVQPTLPHGALVLSRDSTIARCWVSADRQPVWMTKITIVGSPLSFIYHS
jgi:hypothetical protein